MTAIEIVLLIVSFALAGACLWALLQRGSALRERDKAAQERDDALRRLDTATGDEQRSRDTFKSLAGDVLREVKQDFLQLAEKTMELEREKAAGDMELRRKAVDDLVKPIAETLKKTEEKLGAIEKERGAAYAGMLEQIATFRDIGGQLRQETGRLVQALRKPQVRGRYGEIQLERVVELAGMRSYCDFDTQSSSRDSDGRLLRPDMVVRLPNGRVVAVDAKTNIDAYLDAIEAEDPAQAEQHLDRFARHVLDQAGKLASKEYAEALGSSPEFVVMFIPGDQFVDAALARQPKLLDMAAQKRVIIASPSTLIGLLRAVHVGWREKQLTDSAEELFHLGRELHDRAATAFSHVDGLGKAIQAAVRKYNDFVGSVDGRLMPTLRKFEEAGAKSTKQMPAMERADAETRSLSPSTLGLDASDAPAD